MEIYMIEYENSNCCNEINAAIYICDNIEKAIEFSKSQSEKEPTIHHIGTAKNGYTGFLLGAYNDCLDYL